jgi:hypothetical protein
MENLSLEDLSVLSRITKRKPARNFYEKVISVVRDKRSDSLYRISEEDSRKGLRVIFYDLETGLLREYKCRH